MAKDMTRAQFHAALERNGFERPMMVWVSSKDNPNISYGMCSIGGRINYRVTLSHILKSRAEDRAKGPDNAARPPRHLQSPQPAKVRP